MPKHASPFPISMANGAEVVTLWSSALDLPEASVFLKVGSIMHLLAFKFRPELLVMRRQVV